MSTVWKDGGVSVSLSRFGEAFFLVLGATIGLVITSFLLFVLLFVACPRDFDRGRGILAVALGVAVGFFAVPVALTILSLIFFTLPRELFDLLTD
jgi:hypothetical protein